MKSEIFIKKLINNIERFKVTCISNPIKIKNWEEYFEKGDADLVYPPTSKLTCEFRGFRGGED
jgi:hypothetical protein